MRSRFWIAAAVCLGAAISSAAPAGERASAIFAGGCFWCVEDDMDHVKGVTSTISGYAGGTTENPTYRSHEGYTEAVKVEFDALYPGYWMIHCHLLYHQAAGMMTVLHYESFTNGSYDPLASAAEFPRR